MYHVYIITNQHNTTLYTGVTNNMERRIYEHKNKLVKGFSQQYNLSKLVYIESTQTVEDAIIREKQIKGWRRDKKVHLIESVNPKWDNLAV